MVTDEQVAGWKRVTDEVHSKKGHIFCQLFHAGEAWLQLCCSMAPYLSAPAGLAAATWPHYVMLHAAAAGLC
jgi:2,4-dienoyl-CoA reductase-like NADH-dependent reductase (Old Yellow Enzyme family)